PGSVRPRLRRLRAFPGKRRRGYEVDSRRQRAPGPGAGKAREPASMVRDTLIVIPTLNEHDNIVELLEGVHAHCAEADVLIVDDGSPDGTAELAEQVGRRLGHVEVLRRRR